MINSPKDIILQILAEVENGNKGIFKTQLIKFLYLIEVEYYRETGQRLTNLRWLFYHYGPYALELEDILSDGDFAKSGYKTTKDRNVIIYKVAERVDHYNRKVEVKLSLIIKKILGQWINRPLEELLDYIYFDTEPMEAVYKRGDILDFTTIKEGSHQIIIPLTASKETELKVDELRKRIAPTLKKIAEQNRVMEPISEEYLDAMKAWDEETDKDWNAEDLKKVFINITRQLNDSDEKGN